MRQRVCRTDDRRPFHGTRRRLTISLEEVSLDAGYAEVHGGIHLVPGPYVLLAVSDSGAGMGRDTLAKMIEPFFTTKPTGQGTGLGLAMVYGIVKEHDGFVWAYSEPGVGTTIKVYLPVAGDLAASATPGAEYAIGQRSAASNRRTILVVEDEPAVRTLARRALEAAGYAVTEAEHGRRALELLSGSARLPDLVITDAIMPELNGRELCDALSKVHSQLPTLNMSGYTGADVVLRGLVPEGAAFLQKPFTPDALIRQVEGLLAPSER